MNEYTQLLIDLIKDEDITEDAVLETLNNENEDFHDFSDALKRFIHKKYQYNEDDLSFFKRMAKEKKIQFNKNTVNNWFNGNPPKKGDAYRMNMYKIAFALGLNADETAAFFVKVYEDRPFDLKKIPELVYYFGLKNDLSYHNCEEIIEYICVQIEVSDSSDYIYTKRMFYDIDQIQSIDELKRYILQNSSYFYNNNVSAKEVLSGLINDIIIKNEEIGDKRTHEIIKANSIMAKEILLNPDLIRENHMMTSVSTMINVILGTYLTKLKDESGKTPLKNTQLPKNVINAFPTKHTFSKENPTYEELRKMIILLASYKYWYYVQYEEEYQDLSFEDYAYEINDYLIEANLAELYAGNKFDWLFLYCSSSAARGCPLDLFRTIISEAFEE